MESGAFIWRDRAEYFARTICNERPGYLPMSLTQIKIYLLYRAGMRAETIAGLMDVARRHVALRLLAGFSAMAVAGEDRIAYLRRQVEDFGRMRWGDAGDVVRFPCRVRLLAGGAA